MILPITTLLACISLAAATAATEPSSRFAERQAHARALRDKAPGTAVAASDLETEEWAVGYYFGNLDCGNPPFKAEAVKTGVCWNDYSDGTSSYFICSEEHGYAQANFATKNCAGDATITSMEPLNECTLEYGYFDEDLYYRWECANSTSNFKYNFGTSPAEVTMTTNFCEKGATVMEMTMYTANECVKDTLLTSMFVASDCAVPSVSITYHNDDATCNDATTRVEDWAVNDCLGVKYPDQDWYSITQTCDASYVRMRSSAVSQANISLLAALAAVVVGVASALRA